MKQILFFSMIAAFIFTACKKEVAARSDDPENIIPPPVNNTVQDSCHIKTAYYYGGSGGINDTADFFYTGLKLTSVIGTSADVLYTYDGDRVLSMAYYEKPGNLLYHIDTFLYTNDSMITRKISHDYDMYNHFDTVHSVTDFLYSGNLLTQLVTVDHYEGSTDTDTSTSDLRWENDNVKSILFRSSYWADDSIYYNYDMVPNYFNATSRYFFMADPFFQIHVGFDPHLPYFISKNNVINFTIYTNIDYPVTYQVDSMNHPLLVSQGGFEYMGYKWECP
ncbi:MAG: hypothetical protein QM737_07985 [Ferruginibacter sp.]